MVQTVAMTVYQDIIICKQNSFLYELCIYWIVRSNDEQNNIKGLRQKICTWRGTLQNQTKDFYSFVT